MRAAVVETGGVEPHIVVVVGVDIDEFVDAPTVLEAVVVGRREHGGGAGADVVGEGLVGQAAVDMGSDAVVE